MRTAHAPVGKQAASDPGGLDNLQTSVPGIPAYSAVCLQDFCHRPLQHLQEAAIAAEQGAGHSSRRIARLRNAKDFTQRQRWRAGGFRQRIAAVQHPVQVTHRFKGREAPVVILLDALARRYPLIHPNWVFSEIFGDNPSGITDEERRLFYVALTRARDELVIVTRGGDESPFMSGFTRADLTPRIAWENLPDAVPSDGSVIIMVGNKLGRGATPTHEIKDLLKAYGYAWRSVGWPCWWKRVPADRFSLDTVKSESWGENADGIEVRVDGVGENGVQRYLVSRGSWEAVGFL